MGQIINSPASVCLSLMRDRKMEDRKMEDNIWGKVRRWKMRDWKMQDHGRNAFAAGAPPPDPTGGANSAPPDP